MRSAASTVAGGDAFLEPGLAPTLERAICWRYARGAETARMYEQPQCREQVGLENAPQVGLDIRRPGQAGVVASEPQPRAVAREAP